MRRRFLILALLVCSVFAFADDYFEERTAKGMVLPDGEVADVLFFKKWVDANYYIGQKQPKDMKVMIGVKAKTEAEVGYLRKTYKASENESVAALCAIHEETGSVYSVAFVDHGERVTRCVFTYKKGGKLIYDRMDFFDESNGSYADYVARENAKREKILEVTGEVTKTVMEAVTAVAETSIKMQAEQQSAQLQKQNQAELSRQAEEQMRQQSQNQAANLKNSPEYHDKNRAALANYFNSMNKNKMNRSSVTPAELARYEQLIESGVSSSAAAQQVYNEFRK